MSAEYIHRNDGGHVLAEKSAPVEYAPTEPLIIVPTGDFRVTKPGESEPHDIGCLCSSCVARRREQARQPHWREVLEAKCAGLKPEHAAALRRAFVGKP